MNLFDTVCLFKRLSAYCGYAFGNNQSSVFVHGRSRFLICVLGNFGYVLNQSVYIGNRKLGAFKCRVAYLKNFSAFLYSYRCKRLTINKRIAFDFSHGSGKMYRLKRRTEIKCVCRYRGNLASLLKGYTRKRSIVSERSSRQASNGCYTGGYNNGSKSTVSECVFSYRKVKIVAVLCSKEVYISKCITVVKCSKPYSSYACRNGNGSKV